MRILMLSQSYPPIIGGIAIHVRTLSVELASRGHDVAVVTQWYEGLAEYEVDQGVRVYRFHSSMQRMPWLFKNNNRRFAPPFPDVEAVLALRRILKKEQPEIVHAHNWLVYSYLPLKDWGKARLVVTLHDYGLTCPKLTLMHQNEPCEGPGLKKCLSCASQHYGAAKGVPVVLANRVMSRIERGAVDTFLPNSHAVAVGNGLAGTQQPFQVIPHFIPDDVGSLDGDIGPYMAQLPTEDFLLFVGSLSHSKGVDVLLRAYEGLTNAPPLVLIGHQTPEWSRLSVNCPDNVYVLKDWPRYAVLEAWRRCLIGLVPSVWSEPFGLVALEAMSSGRPVIASRTGGLMDIVADGESGLLVQPGNPVALRQAMQQLLADPDLRNRMGQAGLRRFSEFQVSTLVSRFEQAYRNVLQQKAEATRISDTNSAAETA